jgi:hypothetical protein
LAWSDIAVESWRQLGKQGETTKKSLTPHFVRLNRCSKTIMPICNDLDIVNNPSDTVAFGANWGKHAMIFRGMAGPVGDSLPR